MVVDLSFFALFRKSPALYLVSVLSKKNVAWGERFVLRTDLLLSDENTRYPQRCNLALARMVTLRRRGRGRCVERLSEKFVLR